MPVVPNVGVMFLDGATRMPAEARLAVRPGPQGPTDVTWNETARAVRECALGLLDLDIQPGTRVPFVFDEASTLPVLALAVLALRASIVAFPANTPVSALARFIHDQGSSLVSVPGMSWVDRIRSHEGEFPRSTRFVSGDPRAEGMDGRLMSTSALREQGRSSSHDEALVEIARSARVDDEALVVFTKGSHGQSRPLALDHATLLGATEAVAAALPVDKGDRLLSTLSLSDPTAWTAGFLAPLHRQATMLLCDRPATHGYLQEIAPQVWLATPRQLTEMLIQLVWSARPGDFDGWGDAPLPGPADMKALSDSRRGRSPLSRALRRIARPAHRNARLDPFGEPLNRVVVWGRPVDDWVREACAALEVELLELLALSEAGGAVGARRTSEPGGFRGLGAAELEAREGRLRVRAPWFDAGAREEGLETGDLVTVHAEDGLELLAHEANALAGPEAPLAPQRVEQLLEIQPLVRRAFVTGTENGALTVVIEVDQKARGDRFRSLDIYPMHFEEVVTTRFEDRAMVHAVVESVAERLPAGFRFASVRVSLQDWSVENGALTPFGDVNRPALTERLATFPECPPPSERPEEDDA